MTSSAYPFCIPIKENDERIVYADASNGKKDLANVRAATAVVLLEMLTQRQNLDPSFVPAFLVLHREFITPTEFIRLLIQRVEGPKADNATEEQIKLFEQEKVFIRTSSFILFRKWLGYLRPADFQADNILYDHCCEVITKLPEEFRPELYAMMNKLKILPEASSITELKMSNAAKRLSISSPSPPPKLLGKVVKDDLVLSKSRSISFGHLSDAITLPPTLSSSPHGSSHLSLSSSPAQSSPLGGSDIPQAPGSPAQSHHSPAGSPGPSRTQYTHEQIARELLVVDTEFFRSLSPLEFVGLEWNRANKDLLARNVNGWTDWFNKVSGWIATKVVSKEIAEERAAVIESFIAIGMQLLDYHDFSGAMMVLSSLNSAPVARLRGSWELLSSKSLSDLNFLTYLLSNDKNFKNYRQAVEEVPASESAIPYLGVFLTDYTFLCESKPIFFNPAAALLMEEALANGAGGSPTNVGTVRNRSLSVVGSNLINMDRLTTLGAKLREITSLQERPFQSMASSSSLREAILAERILNANELFNLSKLREEKGGFHEALGIVSGKVKRSSKQKQAPSVVDLSDSLVPNIGGVLGDREWSFLLTSAVTRNFNDRDIILTEEKQFTAFYRIIAGTVRLRSIQCCGMLDTTLGPNGVFGEFSILNNDVSILTAMAEGPVEVLEIDLSFIFNLFESEHHLAATFFKSLAVSLAVKFSSGTAALARRKTTLERSDSNYDSDEGGRSSPRLSSSMGNVILSPRDIEYCNRFGLENEIVIKSQPCKLMVNGVIYVSKNYICFYGSMFGLNKQKVIPFSTITRLEKIDKKLVVNVVNSKNIRKFTFASSQEAAEVYAIANPIWTALVSQNPQSPTLAKSPLSPQVPPKSKLRGVAGLPCKEEWDEILKGAKLQTFKKGQIIIEEGTEHRKMYQISKGNCTVEKDLPPSNGESSDSDSDGDQPRRQVVNRLKDGDMFGEISFLLECPATVNVIADSEQVDIYILEISFVNALLNTRPAITPKFYRFLAATLLNRMQFFEQKKGPRLNRYKSSMMRRVNKSIVNMRGDNKSILDSLRADDQERKDTEDEDGGGFSLGMVKKTKLKV